MVCLAAFAFLGALVAVSGDAPPVSEFSVVERLGDGTVVGRVWMPAGEVVRMPLVADPPPAALGMPQLPDHDGQVGRGLPSEVAGETALLAGAQSTAGETRGDEGVAARASPRTTGAQLIIARDTVLPRAPGVGFGAVSEPTVSSQGDGIFQTGNFYAAVSTDNGSTFRYLNTPPLTPSYDQRSEQDPARDLIFWAFCVNNCKVLRLAVAKGQAALASNTWWVHEFTPASVGAPPDESFDFWSLAVGSNYLYLGAYGVSRIPLANLADNTPFTMTTVSPYEFFGFLAHRGRPTRCGACALSAPMASPSVDGERRTPSPKARSSSFEVWRPSESPRATVPAPTDWTRARIALRGSLRSGSAATSWASSVTLRRMVPRAPTPT